jgi:hypothetical protein
VTLLVGRRGGNGELNNAHLLLNKTNTWRNSELRDMPCSPVQFVYCACHPGCAANFTIHEDEDIATLRILVDVSVIEVFAGSVAAPGR